MNNKTIADLRTHLFAALEGLSDPKAPMDIERARAIADVAQTVINTAKVEIDFLRVAGGSGSGFIPAAPALPAGGPASDPLTATTGHGTKTVQQVGGGTVTTHRMR